MSKRIRNTTAQKAKIKMRLIYFAVAITTVVTLTSGILIYLNFQNVSKMRAVGTTIEGGGVNLNNGDIITEFTWEINPVTLATLGPDANSVSADAHSMTGGRASTSGLSAGSNGKDINLTFSSTEVFNQDGIDISLDYRYSEKTCSFFSRTGFNFGLENNKLIIVYRTTNKKGDVESTKAKTDYEVPQDDQFRNYRFIFNPNIGKAEIFVNNLIIWSQNHAKNTPLAWKKNDEIIIAKDMNGDGRDRAILDNYVIRTCGSLMPFAESLLNFNLENKEGKVNIHWSTNVNDQASSFTIERSINGLDFVNVATVKADPTKEEGDEYVYIDKTEPSTGLMYYRLRQTFINGKFVNHQLAAIKIKTDKQLVIESINPQPFDKSFDISYTLPKSGRVWITLTDLKGDIVQTNTFEAPQGKNIHVFKADKPIAPGSYNVNVIFDTKKVSMKISKV